MLQQLKVQQRIIHAIEHLLLCPWGRETCVEIRPSAKDIRLNYISFIDVVVLVFGKRLLLVYTYNTKKMGHSK